MNKRICFASLFLLIATFLVLGSAAAMADTVVYNNGAPNGNDAWTINFGFWVEDSFTLDDHGKPHPDQLRRLAHPWRCHPNRALDDLLCRRRGRRRWPYPPVGHRGSLVRRLLWHRLSGGVLLPPSLQLTPGTYYLRLQNAVVTNGDPAYWAESGGPSKAYQSTVGSIPSESFPGDRVDGHLHNDNNFPHSEPRFPARRVGKQVRKRWEYLRPIEVTPS